MKIGLRLHAQYPCGIEKVIKPDLQWKANSWDMNCFRSYWNGTLCHSASWSLSRSFNF